MRNKSLFNDTPHCSYMNLEELAEAVYWGEGDRDVEVREDLNTERMVDGEYENISGDEYIFTPPIDLGSLLSAIRESNSLVVLGASIGDDGRLHVFCPNPTRQSGNLFDERHDNELP